jgi:hypothetical protein
MTYEEKIMKLDIGKVVKLAGTGFYTHVIGFRYNARYPLNTAIVVMVADEENLISLDNVEL